MTMAHQPSDSLATLLAFAVLLVQGKSVKPNAAVGDLRHPPNPIFVAGCGHTGTTVALRLIGQHPRIHMFARETCAMCNPNITQARRNMMSLDQQFRRTRSQEAVRWVEKTPLHVRSVPEIFAIRPMASVVLLTRNGLDVAASFVERGFTFGRKLGAPVSRNDLPGDGVLQSGVNRWLYDTAITLKAADRARCLLVHYEDLVRNTSATLQRLFAFLGEDFDESQVLSYHTQHQIFNPQAAATATALNGTRHHNASVHDALRTQQFNTPIFDGTGRHRLPPPKGLTDGARALLLAHPPFVALMRKLGYL